MVNPMTFIVHSVLVWFILSCLIMIRVTKGVESEAIRSMTQLKASLGMITTKPELLFDLITVFVILFWPMGYFLQGKKK